MMCGDKQSSHFDPHLIQHVKLQKIKRSSAVLQTAYVSSEPSMVPGASQPCIVQHGIAGSH
jgi:hypothetical protein